MRLLPPGVRIRLGQACLELLALGKAIALARGASGTGAAPAVCYGLARVALPSQLAHGGLVKAQLMQPAFPSSRERFNVLYLISSALPAGSRALARLAAARGAHLVLNQNGVAYQGCHGPGFEATNAPNAALHSSARHVLYQSAFCRASAERFLGPPKGASEILHNPVDTEAFTPAAEPPPLRRLRLLLAGNQDQRYRLTTALETLALLVRRGIDAQLRVTGRLGWARDQRLARRDAEAIVTRLGVKERVDFSGAYAQQDAPELFRSSHVLLHTKYNDPSPGVVLEGLACGLPIVFSSSGGVPELVGSDAGLGVPAEPSWDADIPPDPGALADSVAEASRRWEELSRAARARALRHFRLEPWLARHREIFEALLADA
jgi:glycosyltransferase involved in cell wall biosynthesis